MKKILFLSVYPAPYRYELIDRVKKEYDADVFFEFSGGDSRSAEWFSKGRFFLLDNDAGKYAYRKAIKQIRQYDLVVLYDYSTKEGMKLILRAKMVGIPYVVNSDGVLMAPHGNILKDIMKRLLLNDATAYFASGVNAEKYFLRYGADPKKIYKHTFSTLQETDILRSPVGCQEKRMLRQKLGLLQNGMIAIAVGRFIPLKRYYDLITEWKSMPEDYVLLLIGGGEEEKRYRECIQSNQLRNVIIEGFHPKNELFEYYKAADVFLHPTSYDVWGLVINEAMACGLPVIVSDHCVAGLELVKNGKNGYLVQMGDDRDMCEKATEVLSDSLLHSQMSESALETIRPYTIENMADAHIHAFEEILNDQ